MKGCGDTSKKIVIFASDRITIAWGTVASDVNELSVDFRDEEGNLLCKQLDRRVLSKGAWATVMFRYADMNKQTGEYGEPKVVINRYQKSGGEYKRRSKFNISSAVQARQVIDVLQEWYPNAEGEDVATTE